MTYDKNGLGFAELTEVAVYMPEIYDTVIQALNDGYNEKDVLNTVQKAIEVFNRGQYDY